MVVGQGVDPGLGWIATRKRRDDQHRHTASEERLSVHDVCIDGVGSCRPRWHDMIEKPTPFIAIDNEHGLGPIWTLSERGYDLPQKNFALTQISVRMVVIPRTIVEDGEPGIDKRDRGQIPAGSV